MKTELKPVWFQFAVGDAERFTALIKRIRSDNPGVNKTGALKIICDRLEKLDRDRDGQRRRDQRRPRAQKRGKATGGAAASATTDTASVEAPRSEIPVVPSPAAAPAVVPVAKAPRPGNPSAPRVVLDDPVRKI